MLLLSHVGITVNLCESAASHMWDVMLGAYNPPVPMFRKMNEWYGGVITNTIGNHTSILWPHYFQIDRRWVSTDVEVDKRDIWGDCSGANRCWCQTWFKNNLIFHGSVLLRKHYVVWREFSKLACDWLVFVLPYNQQPGQNVLVK